MVFQTSHLHIRRLEEKIPAHSAGAFRSLRLVQLKASKGGQLEIIWERQKGYS